MHECFKSLQSSQFSAQFLAVVLCVQLSGSKNRVYLDAGALIINVGSKEFDENLESQLVRGKRK